MTEVRLKPEVGQVWRHRSGAEYEVLGVTSEPEPEKAEKFPLSVFYKGPDGRRWTRTLKSWFGSFVFVSHASKSVWDGKGLPPIGCDVLIEKGYAHKCTVVGYTVTQRVPYYLADINLVYKGTDTPCQRALQDVRPLSAHVNVFSKVADIEGLV